MRGDRSKRLSEKNRHDLEILVAKPVDIKRRSGPRPREILIGSSRHAA
jgi:hypothetical protein